jgi:glucokinase
MVDAGIDVGATHLRVAVGSATEIDGHAKRPTPSEGSAAILHALREAFESACVNGSVTAAAVERIGIGSLGPLDREAGAVVDPPNLPGVARLPLVDAVSEWIDGPVTLYNDATAGALGEVVTAAAPPRNLVYVTLSTGIGAGAVVDGHLLVGEHGNAAEVGHLTIDPDSQLGCGCGSTGHWEALCAGNNIPALVRHIADEMDAEPVDALTPEWVFDAADTDPLATRTVEAIGRYNALGVAAVVQAYDPETVVLGGAIAIHNPDAICVPIRERLPSLIVGSAPEVRVSGLGEDVVVRGALAGARPEPLADAYTTPET